MPSFSPPSQKPCSLYALFCFLQLLLFHFALLLLTDMQQIDGFLIFILPIKYIYFDVFSSLFNPTTNRHICRHSYVGLYVGLHNFLVYCFSVSGDSILTYRSTVIYT